MLHFMCFIKEISFMKFLKSGMCSTLLVMRKDLTEQEAEWAVAVGLVLRKARKQANFVQEELAYKSGMGRLTMQRIEYGATSPNLVTLVRLCGALDIPPSTLLLEAEKLMKQPELLREAIAAREAELPAARSASK
ncbi:MAG: XRE family transcriptional regulator [Curvibacter sp.]|nr:MAG: XRE family transcriptional regulator [Curvibacter sp.]